MSGGVTGTAAMLQHAVTKTSRLEAPESSPITPDAAITSGSNNIAARENITISVTTASAQKHKRIRLLPRLGPSSVRKLRDISTNITRLFDNLFAFPILTPYRFHGSP